MNRRRLVSLIILAATCVCSELPADADDSPSRPNIVFAFADDLGRYAGVYADPDHPSANDVITTPHMDRVAAEGALFRHAFVSSPSCTPSRAAVVSCRHFFRNGSHSQLHHPWVKGHPDPFDEVRGFPLMLQDAGYHIGWSYKMHISEDRMGGRSRNYRSAGSRFNSFSQQVSAADDADAAKEKLLNEVRENFRSFLADREGDQPYFYWFNPTNTHRSWTQGSGRTIWGIDPDELTGRLPSFLPDIPLIREDFADYLGEAQAFDAAVGILLQELQERNELDETIFVVSGDHGAPGFPRGKCNLYDFGTEVPLMIRWPAKIPAGTEIAAPVSLIDLGPTYLEAAGLNPSEDMNGSSLLPAIASGDESLLPGRVIFGRENHVDEARAGGLPYPMRALRTADYLYVINFAPDRYPVADFPLSAPLLNPKGGRKDGRRRMDIDFGPTREFFTAHENDPSVQHAFDLGFGLRPAEELYVLNDDRDQVGNVAADPQYADIRNQLRQLLLDELKSNNDPRVIGDGTAFDKPPYAAGIPLRGVVDRSSE